jgi:MSHA biogenesis protein MshN
LQQQQRWSELLAALDEELLTRYGAELIALQAQALWQTQQYPLALSAYQRWTALAPTEARAWLGQALVHEQLAQPQQARVAYQQAQLHGGLSAASLQFIQQRLAALPE